MGTGPTITYSQADRLLSAKTTLGETELLLERFAGAEILSQPFEFKLVLLSTNFDVDIKSLLRTSVTVTIMMADSTKRYFNGTFASLTQAKAGSDIKTPAAPKGGIANPDGVRTAEIAGREVTTGLVGHEGPEGTGGDDG